MNSYTNNGRPAVIRDPRGYRTRTRPVDFWYLLTLVAFAMSIGIAAGYSLNMGDGCTLIDPTTVDAGLDYEDGWWVWADGTRFGSAPTEDSEITPGNCYSSNVNP